jgi:hypothetical protein
MHTADANKKKSFTKEHSADAFKSGVGTQVHTTDSLLTSSLGKTHTTDTLLWSYGDTIRHKNTPIFMEIGNGLFTIIGNQRMPTWDTLGRPANAKNGAFGFNFETNSLEVYDGNFWFSILMSQI